MQMSFHKQLSDFAQAEANGEELQHPELFYMSKLNGSQLCFLEGDGGLQQLWQRYITEPGKA
jgi:hypothetical protein